MKLKLCLNVCVISLYIKYVHFLLLLRKQFGCYGNLSFYRFMIGKVKVGLYFELTLGILTKALHRGARWLSGRVSDSGARGPGFETYRRRVVSLSKTLYSPKVLVNYPGSDGSVPT